MRKDGTGYEPRGLSPHSLHARNKARDLSSDSLHTGTVACRRPRARLDRSRQPVGFVPHSPRHRPRARSSTRLSFTPCMFALFGLMRARWPRWWRQEPTTGPFRCQLPDERSVVRSDWRGIAQSMRPVWLSGVRSDRCGLA